MRSPLLTKSRFKIALECVTQLFYTGKKDLYPDKNVDNEFLQALAKGGYQVGELAKYYFVNDPATELISIGTLDYESALRETEEALNSSEKVVIAEAAFKFENLFVRVDLLVREGNLIKIYEVKAKSTDQNENYLNSKGTSLSSTWSEYFYDVAFQRFVIRKAFEKQQKQFKIQSYLLLINKDVITDIDGMHQYFKVYSENGRFKVVTRIGTQRKDLGAPILIPIETDEICDKIETEFPVPTDLDEDIGFEDFIWKVSDIYKKDARVFTPVGSKCRKCSFYTDETDSANMLSGFDECWLHATSKKTIDRPLITELWNGLAGPRSFTNELVGIGKYFIHEIEEADITPSGNSKTTSSGLIPHERRMEQVNRVKRNTLESYFDAEGIKREMDSWSYPLHMIDFETSAVAVPFFKGMRPYEGIAFQFSHHIIDKDWNVKHQTQFLSFEPGKFPNYDFVRNLQSALSNDDGSIFRYHNHENTYLNMIARQLQGQSDAPADKDELIDFIYSITQDKSSKHIGPRNMIDLYQLVLQYYYSPIAKGSNSLKQILPAIIAESDFLRDKYGKAGVYGRDKSVRSLNFDDHIWITSETGGNPYKTLPRVFEEYDQETLDLLVKDMEDLADGGTAMTAYNFLQFSEVPEAQRMSIRDALLKYCELDTMAMVMLVQGWKHKLK